MQTFFEIEISMDSGGTLMAKTASRNLTTGSPTRLVIGFLLPLLGGLLFQQLYNMVDTLVVGRFLGMDALAGVGSTSSVNFLVLGFCIGICNGFVIPVAQKFGEGDEAELRRFVANSIWLSAAFAVVLTVATGLLCRTILTVMRTPSTRMSTRQTRLTQRPRPLRPTSGKSTRRMKRITRIMIPTAAMRPHPMT